MLSETDFLPSRPEAARRPEAPLAGQVAVVTGATSGIGNAIARRLASEGATLCALGRRQEALDMLVRTVGAPGGKSFGYPLDLSVPEQIEEFASSFARECGQLDILVHSAGVIALGSMESSSVAQLDWHWNVNVRAPYALTRALLPMLKARHGQIVFINSSAAGAATAVSGQYAASKHALGAIADSLRQEVNDDGIRVLNVFVGRTATPMQAAVHASEQRAYLPEKLIQPDDVASVVAHTLGLPRTAEVTAIHMRPLAKPL
ncbi:MAG TPA: SDR family NAD(P)-dependent oxidoreductase [Terriglobales bacterium]|nr:SDR family NAD(P)-dependent oxidoreductase [Terriglobales bacterium]